MNTVYLVYIVDEEEDAYTVDSVFKNKEKAEEHANQYNEANKKFNHSAFLKVREMKFHDDY